LSRGAADDEGQKSGPVGQDCHSTAIEVLVIWVNGNPDAIDACALQKWGE
jgi:hypothetical protein